MVIKPIRGQFAYQIMPLLLVCCQQRDKQIKKEEKDMEKALAFLKQCRTFYLATTEEDQPRVRPFGAVCAFEGKLYIVTNNKKKVYAQILKNPKTEISGMYEGKWIRLAGELVTDDRKEAREAMLAENPMLKSMYSADDGIMEVLYLKNAEASICSFTAPPETWSF